ncbi:hypothetical protein CWE09_04800 [Aliidiomarina minuta]|uniref:DUF4440 domain-containing protein n=1 Tax=Aliidiomarina minuta TaxID=880057 RepID=A0A432W7R0_9GAMM|nr:nuclear transport factor 2 family protein [Aliidiomarina minuta]RUO26049.1 hypothetical protein CWE09_04800 [Aliidiomarina minuta]
MIKEIIKLEKEGWQALSTDSETSHQFFSDILHDDAVMLRPGDKRLAGKKEILESITAEPWEGFKIENERALMLSDKVAVFIYRLTAQHADKGDYAALISSTYVLEDDKLQLILNQHTPL